ncbi:TauD/TfdA dioxygenase family protein [Actinokineospora sp. NPDC004072]
MTLATSFDVRRVGGRIGAEVLGLRLADDLPPATAERLRALLNEHKALFFRGQDLDDASHARFAAAFGELTTAHPTVPSVDGQPHVLAVDGGHGIRANRWHSDVTFIRTPPKATSLRALVIPEHGGNTLIANTAAAYADLPAPLRAFAETLRAVHTNAFDYADPPANAAVAEHRRTFTSRTYRTEHPVVHVHPETGEHALLIGGFADRIVGLSDSDSRDILRLLQNYVTRPENIVRWQWSPGDVLIFDNRATQHYAPDDYGDQPRLLHRVTVAGGTPVGVDGTPSQAIEGDAAHYTSPN